MSTFLSAYRQLQGAERAFVDGYVLQVRQASERSGQHITLALHDTVPNDPMCERPLVIAAIHERIKEIGAETELSVNRVARELVSIAFSNMQDYSDIDEYGTPSLKFEDLSRDKWAAVESFEIEMDPRSPTTVRKRKVKLYSKLEAIKMLLALYDPEQVHLREAANGKLNSDVKSVTVENAADEYAAMING